MTKWSRFTRHRFHTNHNNSLLIFHTRPFLLSLSSRKHNKRSRLRYLFPLVQGIRDMPLFRVKIASCVLELNYYGMYPYSFLPSFDREIVLKMDHHYRWNGESCFRKCGGFWFVGGCVGFSCGRDFFGFFFLSVQRTHVVFRFVCKGMSSGFEKLMYILGYRYV